MISLLRLQVDGCDGVKVPSISHLTVSGPLSSKLASQLNVTISPTNTFPVEEELPSVIEGTAQAK